jgi:hypothetical protein
VNTTSTNEAAGSDSERRAVRALLQMAHALGGDAAGGVHALLAAAAVAAHGIRLPVDEAIDTLIDNMLICAAVEAEQPRSS